MKKLFIIGLLALVGVPVPAQYIVYDPTVNIEQIISQAENIAKYVEMVNNQVQQIKQLTAQLQQLEQYNKAFGDPSKILNVTGIAGLTADLKKTPVAQSLFQLETSNDGSAALTYNGNGLYVQIGGNFTTPSGNQVQRAIANYKSFEAVNKATGNYTNVAADVLQRRQTLKDDIATTAQALQAATTASEVQKLTGVLIGLHADLSATDKEIDQALALSLVQDIENRNDIEKQSAARREEQKAEMVETFQNYRTNFTLNTRPPLFQEGSQ
jgi:hypothetical protein